MKKILFIFVFVAIFFLSSCFEKKDTPVVDSGSLETQSGILETPSSTGENISNIPEITSSGNLDVSEPSTSSPEVSQGTGSQNVSAQEQEIVDEYSEDLEKLFDDILKSE